HRYAGGKILVRKMLVPLELQSIDFASLALFDSIEHGCARRLLVDAAGYLRVEEAFGLKIGGQIFLTLLNQVGIDRVLLVDGNKPFLCSSPNPSTLDPDPDLRP